MDQLVLAEAFAYEPRGGRGSHRVYEHSTVRERLNLQPDNHGKAKEYQGKQLLDVVDTYDLHLEDES